MARYGPHRTYKVNSIKWDMNPTNYTFESGEEVTKKMNMLEYFKNSYNTKITDTR